MSELVTNRLDPALAEKIDLLIEDGILTNEKLAAILDTIRKRGERKRKKDHKRTVAASVVEEKEVVLNNPTLISYAQSAKVWGKGLIIPQNKMHHLTPPHKNPAFKDPRFNFKQVVLYGLSPQKMAERFPDHNWNSHRRNDNQGEPGHYLVSFDNPLVNLTPAKEKDQWPKDCFRLDFNLTIELLLAMKQLELPVPDLFYRTTILGGHNQELCVGFQNEKIIFLEAKKVREDKKMGILLVKAEKWMSE